MSDFDALREAIRNAEAKLSALRARRQRWVARYEAAVGVRGAAQERAQARHNLGLVDKLIVEAEANVKKTQNGASFTENRAIRAEEEFEELRKLAADCDAHARALGISLKELHSKLSAARAENKGRGPSALMVTMNLRQSAEKYFDGTALRLYPPSPTRKTFVQLIDSWRSSLLPSTPPPPSPLPPQPAA